MKLEYAPVKTELSDDRNLFTWPWAKWFNKLVNWMMSHTHGTDDGTQISHLNLSNIGTNTHVQIDTAIALTVPLAHVAATVTDTTSVNLTISGQNISADVIASGIDHALLNDLNSSSYTHLTAANATDLTDGGATTLHKHDHGNMDGLADDDHTQYHNNTRGDARYPILVNPSVNNNFVAFNGIAGQQKDSGYKASDFSVAAHDNFDEVFLLMGA